MQKALEANRLLNSQLKVMIDDNDNTSETIRNDKKLQLLTTQDYINEPSLEKPSALKTRLNVKKAKEYLNEISQRLNFKDNEEQEISKISQRLSSLQQDDIVSQGQKSMDMDKQQILSQSNIESPLSSKLLLNQHLNSPGQISTSSHQQDPLINQISKQESKLTFIIDPPQKLEYDHKIEQYLPQKYELSKLKEMEMSPSPEKIYSENNRLQYPNGMVYVGDLNNKIREGYGKLYVNKDISDLIYEGEWENDVYNGNGKLNNLDQKEFSEQFDFKDFNKMSNKWASYQGNFVDGKKQGVGTIYLTNGDKFIGKFSNDQVNSTGNFIGKNGKTIGGIWKNNQLVYQI